MMGFLARITGLGEPLVLKLLYTAATVAVLLLLRRVVVSAVCRRTEEARIRYMWQKTSAYAAAAAGALILLRVWFPVIGSPVTYFGLLSAGVAIALKDPLTDVAGWLFIVFRRPFSLGDRISIGRHAGDVIDIRVFAFSILEIGNWVEADQSTGRIIHVPNGMVFSEPVANFTQGFRFIWNEIPVLLTFESDWREAKKALLEIAGRHSLHLGERAEKEIREASRQYMVHYSKLTPIVYTDVRDSGVLLTIRYLCAVKARRSTQESIWEDVLSFVESRSDVALAYPSQRIVLTDGGVGG